MSGSIPCGKGSFVQLRGAWRATRPPPRGDRIGMPRTRPTYRPAGPRAFVAALVVLGTTFAVAGPSRAAGWAPHQVVVGYRTRRWSPGAIEARTEMAGGAARAAVARRAAAVRTRVVRLPAGESVASALARLRRRRGVAC